MARTCAIEAARPSRDEFVDPLSPMIAVPRGTAPVLADSRLVHARSALFDLYGDHLRARGDRAPVAALVRLLAPLGVAAPAVRTASRRMVRQGWLRAGPAVDGARATR